MRRWCSRLRDDDDDGEEEEEEAEDADSRSSTHSSLRPSRRARFAVVARAVRTAHRR